MRLAAALLFFLASLAGAADIRLGIVGVDTSHATVWTQMINDPSSPTHVDGVKVVAAFKGGSPDIESSISRVDKYEQELRTKWNIEFAPDIPSLCSKVDGVLILSVDGRTHLGYAKQVFAAHKPAYIDKPLAATIGDAREINRLAKQAGVPWFTSSSLRFGETATTLKSPDNLGVTTWGPGPLEEHHHLDLAWYAIHPIELLYTLMGPGCEQVTRTSTPDFDVLVGVWKGGRIGTARAIRPYSTYGAVVYRPKEQVVQSNPNWKDDYSGLIRELVRFFQTGKPPVPNAESMEIYEFMDAAVRSKQAGGVPVKLQ